MNLSLLYLCVLHYKPKIFGIGGLFNLLLLDLWTNLDLTKRLTGFRCRINLLIRALVVI